MKLQTFTVLILAALAPFFCSAANPRMAKNFDDDWLFLKSDAADAQQVHFDDSSWRKLNLPHDWSIEGPFAETNSTRGSGGFLPAGTGWYRKHFTLPNSDADKKVFIQFEGVMANSDVWINGFHLGHRPNGYVELNYNLTGHLNFGGDNVIAVRCDNSLQPASRFYCGAGIYRHVRLVVTDPIHFAQNGIFVSTPEVSETQATVRVQCEVTNESDSAQGVFAGFSILDSLGKIAGSGETVTQTIEPHETKRIEQSITIKNPQRWDLEKPALYRAAVALNAGLNGPTSHSMTKLLDEQTNTFGIREFHFDADTGFWLNGKNFKVKGVCLHADGGAFGMAVPDSIWEDRLRTLKALGVNAIRTAHNPPSPEFLDLCDRLGFLVMDEMFDCWTISKSGLDGVKLQDYHLYFNDWSKIDTADIVRRDRNHPSIILYSAGNEIHDTPNASLAKGILAGLIDVFHTNDPTRPVTQALFRPNASHDYDDGLADMLDVIGQNYREKEILAAHEQKPSRKIIGTETTHSREQWVAMRDHPPYAGQFIWTGVDYWGESRRWPLVAHGSGLLDRTGASRPVAFERQSWWSDKPMVYMARRVARNDAMPTDPGYAGDELYSMVLFSDWTPKNLQPHNENVEVYSNCKTVELFLNGKSLGAKEIHADASPRNWMVSFVPGTLKAVARNEKDKVVATEELKTAGAPAKIVLSTETATLSPGFEKVAIVRAKITDKRGIEIPLANDLVSFRISGPGEIAAVDNANNLSHELFQTNERHAFHGECVAFVRATNYGGGIKVKATAPDLAGDSIVIKTAK
ncbi:MAG TPA: glycoside hydrolase family 2 TIM barrel-domain containing protein [Verrucomicrobiae bacterium]|nr:glycoside hydrolase family 2 TIM barrel-domain containing protein [Verrucomicrobiae bacterium]